MGLPYYEYDKEKNKHIKKFGKLYINFIPIFPSSTYDIEYSEIFKKSIKDNFKPLYTNASPE